VHVSVCVSVVGADGFHVGCADRKLTPERELLFSNRTTLYDELCFEPCTSPSTLNEICTREAVSGGLPVENAELESALLLFSPCWMLL